MKTLTDSTWAFGGPLADAPAETAWSLLAIAAALIGVLAWISYRNAVIRLGVVPSVLLVALRVACIAALLVCLANPLRIERLTRQLPPAPPPPPPPPIAVVVDRSDSMSVPDNRGRTRLDDALTTWHRLEKTAEAAFSPIRAYSIAEDLRPAASLNEAAARTDGTYETRLYRSVATLLKNPAGERPAAVVVLTDGLDTSADPDSLLREAALESGTPVYFIAGTNRSARPQPFFRVREWRAPSVAMRNSVFTMDATFEAFSRADRTLSYSLWQGNRRIDGGRLSLTTGSNVVGGSFTANASEPGVLEFTLRLGDTPVSPVIAKSSTRVIDKHPIRVLVYQGGLDWGLRYLTQALRTDSNFEFATVVAPAAGVNVARDTRAGGRTVGQLPEDARALALFDCIVLIQTPADALTRAQQGALVDFVRDGGSLLVITPTTEEIPQYDGSRLADVLPVNFGRMIPRTSRSSGGRVSLSAFLLTEAGATSPVFAEGDAAGKLLPRFAEFVPVVGVKPGAEVLAVHPTARSPETGAPFILLATQIFGRGRSAFLATDALWRWKLNEDSSSTVVEKFWQQLILALGRRAEAEELRFVNAPAQVQKGRTVTLRLGGADPRRTPTVAAKSPSGQIIALSVRTADDKDAPWKVEWTPAEAGSWELAAASEGAHRAHIYPSVIDEPTGELAQTPPAIDALRTLAADTGGALLSQEPPASWRAATDKEKTPEPVVTERRFALWDRWEMLLLALGCFAAELVLRRMLKLL